MAEYLILIYGDESAAARSDAESTNIMMKGHQEFGERNAAALRGGTPCNPRPRRRRCARMHRVASW